MYSVCLSAQNFPMTFLGRWQQQAEMHATKTSAKQEDKQKNEEKKKDRRNHFRAKTEKQRETDTLGNDGLS